MKKNRITVQTLRDLDLKQLNNVLQDIYRELNRIGDSSDKVSLKKTKEGFLQLILNQENKEYSTNSLIAGDGTKQSERTLSKNTKEKLELDRVKNVDTSSANNITRGTLNTARIPDLDASKITSGTIDNARISLDAAEIPNIDASKITSGTINNARITLDAAEIPTLDASKIGTGTIDNARISLDAAEIPNLSADKITSDSFHLDRIPSITNAKLANDSISLGGVSVDLGGSDATPAFDLQDSTNTNLASIKSGTQITTAQIDVSANVKTLLDNDNTADFKTDLSLVKGDVGLGNVTNDAQVTKATFDAHTILVANSDNTPSALSVGASQIVGRKASGNITAMTKGEAQIVLNVADGATATVDLTVDGAGTVHANNYTNTTYSEATGSSAGLMSTAHHDKLDGVEAGADVTDGTNVTAAGALMDSELTDLSGIKGLSVGDLASQDTINNSDWSGTALADGNIASASTWNAKLDKSGTIADNDFAKFSSGDLVGRSYTETKSDLSLGNVEDTALSTWGGTSNITTVGTIGTGEWNGTVIAEAKGGTGVTSTTTIGKALLGIADVSAESFLRINANETITVRSAADFRGDIGAGTSSLTLGTSGSTALAGDTNVLKWDGGSSGLTAGTGRTSLGLGTAATKDTGTGSSNVILGDDSRLTDARECDNTFSSAGTARGNLGGTTIGQNLFTLTNPGAETYLKIAADNTVSTRSASDFRGDIGAGTSSLALGTTGSTALAGDTNVLKWDGGSTGLTASTGRASLGGTTTGQALFTLADGSGSRFIRIDDDDGVTVRTASNFRSDIGAGTSNFDGAYSSLSSIPSTFAPIVGTNSDEALAGNTTVTNWSGGSSGLTASTGRTSLGGTTVGQNLFTLSNPGAVRFVRLNADNTVTAQSDDDFKTALTLNNVTNESKATMFDDPIFTGEPTVSHIKHSQTTLPIINKDDDEDTIVNIIAPAASYRSTLRFGTGALARWLVSYKIPSSGSDPATLDFFGIGSGSSPDLTATPHVSLSKTGDITATGTLTGANVTTAGAVSFGSLTDSGESITVTKFVDESDGIASNDNDTTIPTSAAVRDYVDGKTSTFDWTFTTGGYCRTSDTNFYMSSYKGDETWANALTVNLGAGGGYVYSDVPAVEWIAPAAGKATNIRIVTRASAVADEMKITIFKGTLADDQASIALTAMGTATNAMGATNKYYYTTQDLSVSNTFSAGDGIFVAFAKTEDTGTSTYNFSVTVSGEFT